MKRMQCIGGCCKSTDQRLDDLESAVTVLEAELEHKACKEVVDSLSNRVDTIYDKLDTRVDEMEAKVSQFEKELPNKANKEDLESLEVQVTEISVDLENKVDWTNTGDENNPNRKSIILENHDSIMGLDTKGGRFGIAMVSKWNTVDLASTKLPTNINSKDGRVTINSDKVVATEEFIEEKIAQISVYTKDEIDAKIDEVKNISLETKSELEEIKKNLEDLDLTKRFVQIDEETFANLEDGDILQWDGTKWTKTVLGAVRTIE